MPYEIPDFSKGKQTRNGQPTPTEPFVATVVPKDEALEFFRCSDRAELTRHLRGLRDLDLLAHGKQGLAQAVRIGPDERIRAYVVRGKEEDIPRRKMRRRSRVFAA